MASQQLELQRAKAAFREFHTNLSARQAKFVPLGGHSAPVVALVQVSRQEFLDRFLTQNPEFKGFHQQLAESFPKLSEFTLHKECWEAVSRSA